MDPSSLISLPGTRHFPAVGVLLSAGSPTAVMGHRDAAAGESTVTEQSWRSRSRKKRRNSGSRAAAVAAVPDKDTSKFLSTSSGGNELAGSESKRLKSGENNVALKVDAEASSGGNKPVHPKQPKQDYIHVRARRGQATDSHSLAERARRDKISERMKILQDLVPGCHKVIGKASVLDEIINYIQALQHQIEFLSMKLEAVTSQINPGMEDFPTKNPTREFGQGSATEWLHMQVGGAFERVS